MNEIKIGIIGSANCSKSTTIGVLVHNILDDGRGLARSKILGHQHELETGRTSSVSKHFITYDNSNRFISLFDLAGHEKYLRTTLYGLSGHYLDYVIIIIDSNAGVLRMTKEHLSIALALRIPIIIVLSKIDMCPERRYKESMDEIKSMIRLYHVPQRFTQIITNNEDTSKLLLEFNDHKYIYCPIFSISNKTGQGVDLLRQFVNGLPSRFHEIRNGMIHKNIKAEDNVPEIHDVFKIYHKYDVKGIGFVFTGYVRDGEIVPNTKMLLGPLDGGWKEVIVKSLHNNFQTSIDVLKTGESGCVAVRIIDKKYKFNRKKVKKGLVLTNHARLSRNFMANIYIMSSHTTTIKVGYQPIMNCNNISQAVIVKKIYDGENNQEEKVLIRGKDKAQVEFELMFRGEYLEEGDLFIFREGRVRGLGRIMKLL